MIQVIIIIGLCVVWFGLGFVAGEDNGHER